jgi:hypothetical protein
MSDYKERIRDIRNQILMILSDRHNGQDMHERLSDECSHSLGRAVSLLNDATIQVDHPTVAATAIAYFDSSEYSHAGIPYRASFLCGILPDTSERVTPANGIPDCPECLALLEAQKNTRSKLV